MWTACPLSPREITSSGLNRVSDSFFTLLSSTINLRLSWWTTLFTTFYGIILPLISTTKILDPYIFIWPYIWSGPQSILRKSSPQIRVNLSYRSTLFPLLTLFYPFNQLLFNFLSYTFPLLGILGPFNVCVTFKFFIGKDLVIKVHEL